MIRLELRNLRGRHFTYAIPKETARYTETKVEVKCEVHLRAGYEDQVV